MSPLEFCNRHDACAEGRAFALKFETMAEVWDACENPNWLFWILEKHAPLEKAQSVRLSIAFAETCIGNYTADERPALAIAAAKAWLENPCDETESAARSAAEAARSARSAAWSAARSAARSENCKIIRNAINNPFS